MTFLQALEGLLQGRHLGIEDAEDLMGQILRGELGEAQIGGLLMALRSKGAAPTELAGFALAMRNSSERLETGFPDLVDTCGTGGGPATFNLSTGAAIVAAAAGARIAKHGNRAVTSKCGSADVLEALGVKLDFDLATQAERLRRHGIVFLFAPAHHRAMRHVGPARKALGVRTVFNQLGPLANPAGAKRQLIGVYDRSLVAPMAEALVLLGAERAFVVHSEEGLDEVSPCGPTFAIEVRGGGLTEHTLTPGTFGIEPVSLNEIGPGDTVESAASALVAALSGKDEVRARALLPDAAVALVLAGVAADFPEGAQTAQDAILSGAASRLLAEMAQ